MLRMPKIFGNHMVFQRNCKIQIWGYANANESVSVEIQACKDKVRADNNGAWTLTIGPLHVSEEETITISTNKECITFKDIAIGEVWLAGGQSNMEFQMRYDRDYKKALSKCNNKNIRIYDVPSISTEELLKLRDYSEFGYWRVCNENNLQYFSAVAYYFAENIQSALGIPVGIIGCNYGGSRSCCWMDEKTVASCGQIWLDDYQKGIQAIPDLDKAEKQYYSNSFMDTSKPFANPFLDKMMYGLPQNELVTMFQQMGAGGAGNQIGPWHEWRPSGLYYTMLEKVIPYTIKGVLWYQGESDDEHPEIYADMMTGLIGLWRKRWGYDIPFIMAQLAPLGEEIGNGGKYYPLLRKQQDEVTKRVENVWCIPTGDVGSKYDIHPKEKQPIGKRMALTARGNIYGEDILCNSPIPDKIQRTDTGIKIIFDYVGDGLILKGSRVQALELFDVNERKVDEELYNCEVLGNELYIVFKKKLITEPLRIDFAQTPFFSVNLYNSADIPVKPFTLKCPMHTE